VGTIMVAVRSKLTLLSERARAPFAAALAVIALPAAALAAAGLMSASAAAAVIGPQHPAFQSRTIRVTTLTDSGYGSLRWAIRHANDTRPGLCAQIDFSVGGVIHLLSALPAVTACVLINAQSLPTWQAGDPPPVAVDCHGHPGLVFGPGSAGSDLISLAVYHAGGNGITVLAPHIRLNDDYIGLRLDGSAAGNRGDGIYVASRSSHDRIGIDPSGDPAGNVISANGRNGIELAGASSNTVAANRIGTNVAGTAPAGNRLNGILIAGRAVDNEIGGTKFSDPVTGMKNNPTGSKGTTTPVFVVPPLGNQISGNGANGVQLSSGAARNKLNGNFIGTSASGNGAIGNHQNGVWLYHAPGNSLTGCKVVNNPFVYYNVISGNKASGLRVTDSDNVVVQGNFFGAGANNTTLVGNRRDGILIDGSSRNTQVGGVIPLGNVAAGNGANGIEVTGRARGFVTFNTFGGLLAFKGAAPNGNDGLLITSTGGHNLVRTNVFSGNRRNGIQLAGNASGVTVDPDIAGLTTSGKAALPNGGDGLLIDGSAHGNVIGGSRVSVIPQNTFSGNKGYGVAITGRAHGNKVFSSFIGTAILGVTAIGNHRGGVLLGGSAYANEIGDGRKFPANLISGNIGIGVTLGFGTEANLVTRNYIGFDRFGHKLANTGKPVVDHGHNVVKHNKT
jgi:parallel beta-helix repeat protein